MSDETPHADALEGIAASARLLGQALTEWMEAMRPAFDAFASAISRPDVQAAIEAARAGAPRQPCWCLCGAAHPDEQGFCDGMAAVFQRVESPRLGPVHVACCGPCAAAAQIAQRAADAP